jgi:hypothetical protein
LTAASIISISIEYHGGRAEILGNASGGWRGEDATRVTSSLGTGELVREGKGEGPGGHTGICLFGTGEEVLLRLSAGDTDPGGGVVWRSGCCCTTTVAMLGVAQDVAGSI